MRRIWGVLVCGVARRGTECLEPDRGTGGVLRVVLKLPVHEASLWRLCKVREPLNAMIGNIPRQSAIRIEHWLQGVA